MIDSARFLRRCLPVTTSTESPAATVAIDSGMGDYARLQQRLMLATAVISLVALLVALVGFNAAVARSLLVGSCAGVLYLRLLSRSVARLGGGSRQVGRFQLVVPVLLIVAAAKFPQLDLLPAFIGFLLYKPALILQTVIDG